jgi:hypothetical protein
VNDIAAQLQRGLLAKRLTTGASSSLHAEFTVSGKNGNFFRSAELCF